MAWNTIATLAGLGDTTAASLVNSTASQTHRAISNQFGALVAAQMATNQTIKDAAAAAMSDAAVQAQLAWSKTPVASATNLDTVTAPGMYAVTDAAVAATLTNMPAAVAGQPGILTVARQPGTTATWRVAQRWTVFAYATGQPPREFIRQIDANIVSEWAEVLTDKPMAPQVSRGSLLRQASKVRHGGRVGTAGATPIALSFDHGFAKFRDLLLPELRRLGLPATIAVCTDDLGAGENLGVSYPELQTWALNYGLEVANHGRSHAEQTNQTNLRNAILNNSLDLLRTNLPKLTVDSFIMPGVSGTWMGFNAGSDLQQWSEHVAGRWILGNHAVATGVNGGRAHPVAGEPVQSANRIGFDTSAGADTITALIPRLHGTGLGAHIYCHPNLINGTGQITLARVVQLLEFIAAERDAGRVEVLTVSGFAWSDPDSAQRPDLAVLSGGFVSGVVAVDVSSVAPWARTGQWVLTVAGAGVVSAQVTDNTGVLSASHSATGRVRVAFTIPADATTVTLTVPSTATAHVRAV